MVPRRSEDVADDIDVAIERPDVDRRRIPPLRLAGLRSRQLVAKHRRVTARAVIQVHREAVPRVPLEQDHPRAGVVAADDARHHPRGNVIGHVGHVVVREHRAGVRAEHDRSGHMMKDVVHDQIV